MMNRYLSFLSKNVGIANWNSVVGILMEQSGYNLYYSVACVPKLDECFKASCGAFCLFLWSTIMF